jgi:hypothetical protein
MIFDRLIGLMVKDCLIDYNNNHGLKDHNK